MTAVLPASRGTGPRRSRRATLGVYAVTAVGGLVVSLDVSIANALLPAIGRDLPGAGRAALSWVITGYAIAFAAALVPAGRVADRAGRRRTYLGGLLAFAAGSLICGLAPNLAVLLLGRVVQGLGAAAASPASLALLLAVCDPRERATQAARWTGAAALGMCLGPLVGGALTTAGSWRWAFLVNLPVVAIVARWAPRLLPETPRHPGRPLPDTWGTGLFALAAAVLTLVLSEITTWGPGSVRTIGGVALATLLAAAFVRRTGRVAEPMLDLTMLRNRRVAVAAAATVCYSAGFFGFLLTVMLFLVGHWHLGLVRAGAAVLLVGGPVVALTSQVGRLVDRLGHRLPLIVGTGLMSLMLATIAITVDGDRFEPRWFALGPLLGLGIGLCYPVLAGAAVHGLDASQLAAASAVNQCARQLGAAVGVAAAVGVLGSAATPAVGRFHTAWLLEAAFSVVAVAAAAFLPHDPTPE